MNGFPGNRDEERRDEFELASLPVIATVARLLCRELTLQNKYLRIENKVLNA
jgi:hypothetical protein